MLGRPQIWPEYFPGGGGGWGSSTYQWQGYQGGNNNPQGGAGYTPEDPTGAAAVTPPSWASGLQPAEQVLAGAEESNDFGKWILIGVLAWAILG